MNMHEIPKLDKKGLRDFGLILGGMVGFVFGIVLPFIWRHSSPVWPWGVLGVLWVWALAAPLTLNPVYQVWMRFGQALGWVETRIVLGVIFYLIVFPLGLIMRLLGHEPMCRSFDRNLETYRVLSQVRTRESMEKPF